MIHVSIAKDFTNKPGGRFIAEGPYSGELFRTQILSPKYKEATEKGEKLTVDLDGCYGYATSFIEESFGGLARELKSKKILDNIILISLDEPALIDEIKQDIEDTEI